MRAAVRDIKTTTSVFYYDEEGKWTAVPDWKSFSALAILFILDLTLIFGGIYFCHRMGWF